MDAGGKAGDAGELGQSRLQRARSWPAPHPEERAQNGAGPISRLCVARVSKDEGGLMLRDASQRAVFAQTHVVVSRCDAPQHEAERILRRCTAITPSPPLRPVAGLWPSARFPT